MPTEKPRVTITMSETQLKQIDDFRFENKIKNQTQAMVLLMEEGMKSIVEQQEEHKKMTPSVGDPTPEDKQKEIVDRFAKSLEQAGIISHGGDISKNDMEFLYAMSVAMKAHFNHSEERRD